MRSGSTQSSPTGIPYIRFTVGEDTYVFDGSGSRIKAIRTDEQPFGSKYDVVLDNSDGTLTTKEYDGLEAYLSFGFVTETLSPLPKFWVLNTQLSSEDGEMLMTITCIDAWGLMSFASANFVSSYFNQEWQKEDSLDLMSLPSGEDIPPTLIAELNAGYNKTIFSIITKLVLDSCGEGVYLPPADNDGRINTLTPPISVSDPVSGIQQVLSLTSCYLLWCDVSGTSKFKVVNPTVHTTVYEYNVSNLFFSNVDSVSVTTPNQVNIWAYDEDGDAWINGVDNDLESQGKLGVTIPVHYFLANMSLDARASQAELTSMAEGYLSKIQGERSVGVIVAPMHCSQELFDKISVTDDSYSPSRIVTGYVHRIVREFEAGTNIYRATLQIGGVATGFVPEGGRVPTPLAQIDPPTTPVFKEKFPEWADILPRAIQGYSHDITFYITDWNTVSWTGGTITFYDGTTQTVSAGNTGNLQTDEIYVVYFDLVDAHPNMLKVALRTTYYSTIISEYTGTLCLVQRCLTGSGTGHKATMLPSYGKEPYISTDWIDMSGFKNWVDPETGDSYSAVLTTDISAGHIHISSDTVFALGYDPSTKRQTFISTPTTPYYIGDLWISDTVVKRCTTQRLTGSYSASDWTATTMDAISDGTLYSRVLTTDIQSGHIKLSSTVKDGKWYDESGVEIDANTGINIYGRDAAFTTRATKTGAIQCKVDSSGNISAGAGNVLLNASGLQIKANDVLQIYDIF